MIKLGIAGIAGRMGRRIAALARQRKNLKLVFGLENQGNPECGKMVEGILVVDTPQIIKTCDCLIDFTTPQATIDHLAYAVKYHKRLVIGTTGLDEKQQKIIKHAAQKIPIVYSPNMSVGVNLLFTLVEVASRIIKDYRVSITEAHHIHKKDAPSGTAKKLAQIVNQAGFRLKPEDITSIREGEIVGDHRVVFESPFDTIELFHSAKTRDIFVQGALSAAEWLSKKKCQKGLFSMKEVIF